MNIESLKNHPVFGKLIRDIPKEVSEASNKVSSALQKNAIVNDNPQPYIEYQIEQGITYAKMGLVSNRSLVLARQTNRLSFLSLYFKLILIIYLNNKIK